MSTTSPVLLVPLEGVCLGRTVVREHVAALIVSGRLAHPTDEGLVPPDYLSGIDPDVVPSLPPGEWRGHVDRELRRYRDGRARLLHLAGHEHERRREQQLMRIASAAWGLALALCMEDEVVAARAWLDRAATLYRRSLADASPRSWGRSIGALKSRILGGDDAGAAREATYTLDLGAAADASPIARYAACISFLVRGDDQSALDAAAFLIRDDSFPPATARALRSVASYDARAYEGDLQGVLETFETRDRFLEDVPVADTVLMLEALARARGIAAGLASIRLPPSRDGR